jgi:hypothetical protein
MLYLAQVKNSFNKDSLDLQLIAYQQANLSWSICHPEIITLHNSNFLNEGVLVLVNVEENKDVVDIKEAKDWILTLINIYLNSESLSLENLQREKSKLEEWKQELTSEQQKITQDRLELETRLEQLQELEDNLKKMIKQQEN